MHEVVTFLEYLFAVPIVAAMWYGIAMIGGNHSEKVLREHKVVLPANKPKPTASVASKSLPARYDEPYDGDEFAGLGEAAFVDDDTFFGHL